MYVAKWPLFASIIFIRVFGRVNAQSTCEFMRQTPLDLDSMPREPQAGLFFVSWGLLNVF
jgi:hypothetical protein